LKIRGLTQKEYDSCGNSENLRLKLKSSFDKFEKEFKNFLKTESDELKKVKDEFDIAKEYIKKLKKISLRIFNMN
jgi:hypothetical protein